VGSLGPLLRPRTRRRQNGSGSQEHTDGGSPVHIGHRRHMMNPLLESSKAR
jgi:hypothetical protein